MTLNRVSIIIRWGGRDIFCGNRASLWIEDSGKKCRSLGSFLKSLIGEERLILNASLFDVKQNGDVKESRDMPALREEVFSQHRHVVLKYASGDWYFSLALENCQGEHPPEAAGIGVHFSAYGGQLHHTPLL